MEREVRIKFVVDSDEAQTELEQLSTAGQEIRENLQDALQVRIDSSAAANQAESEIEKIVDAGESGAENIKDALTNAVEEGLDEAPARRFGDAAKGQINSRLGEVDATPAQQEIESKVSRGIRNGFDELRNRAVATASGIGLGTFFVQAFLGEVEQQRAGTRLTAQLALDAQEAERAGKVAGIATASGLLEGIATETELNTTIRDALQNNLASFETDTDRTIARVVAGLELISEVTEVQQDRLAGIAGDLIEFEIVANADEAFDVISAVQSQIGGADLAAGFQGFFDSATGIATLDENIEKLKPDKLQEIAKLFEVSRRELNSLLKAASSGDIEAITRIGSEIEDLDAIAERQIGDDLFGGQARNVVPLLAALDDLRGDYGLTGDEFEDLAKRLNSDATVESTERLSASFTQFKDILGEALIPVIVPFVDALSDILGVVNPLTTSVGDFLVALDDAGVLIPILTGITAGLATKFVTLRIAAIALGPAMAVATGPIGLIALAVTGLVTAGILLVENWDTVKSAASTTWAAISNTVGGFIQGLIDIVNTLIDTINLIPFVDIPTIPDIRETRGSGRSFDALPVEANLRGGLTNKPTLSLSSEDYHLEAIVADREPIEHTASILGQTSILGRLYDMWDSQREAEIPAGVTGTTVLGAPVFNVTVNDYSRDSDGEKALKYKRIADKTLSEWRRGRAVLAV